MEQTKDKAELKKLKDYLQNKKEQAEQSFKSVQQFSKAPSEKAAKTTGKAVPAPAPLALQQRMPAGAANTRTEVPSKMPEIGNTLINDGKYKQFGEVGIAVVAMALIIGVRKLTRLLSKKFSEDTAKILVYGSFVLVYLAAGGTVIGGAREIIAIYSDPEQWLLDKLTDVET